MLVAFFYNSFRIWKEADKRSALYALEHTDLFALIVVTVVTFFVWNTLVIGIEILANLISNYDLSQKLSNRLYKLGILISLIIAMLYTETSDQFQLLATLISFVLIFNFLVPNDLNNLFAEIFRNANHKRHNHKK